MFSRLISAIFKDRDGHVGRKLVAAWAVTALATFMLIFHVFVNLLVVPTQHIEPVLDGGAYQLILIAVWGTFFASDSANLWAFNVRKNGNEPGTDIRSTGEKVDGGGAAHQRTPDNAG